MSRVQDPRSDEPTDIGHASALKETSAGLCVRRRGDEKDIWLPKAHIHDDSEVYALGTSGRLVVKRWLAVERGYVEGDD